MFFCVPRSVKAMTGMAMALLCLLCQASLAKEAKRPLVATTIDFLDYAMGDDAAIEPSFYPLSSYERRLEELAACGIRKLYLRVNVCGLSHYPSQVTWQYGEHGNYHYRVPKHSRRVMETLKRYNPLRETIRIGRRLGMEVWAWESVWDDAGASGGVVTASEASPEWCAKYGNYFLMDPFFRKNYHFYAMKKPSGKPLSEEQVAAINQSARGRGVGRIEILSADRHAPATFTRKELIIAVSQDNVHFSIYNGPCELRHDLTAEGRPRVTLDKLQMDANYVQLMFKTPRPKDGKLCAIIHRKARGQHCVYDRQGKPLPSVWSWSTAPDKRGASVRSSDTPAAWDFGDRGLGFLVGEEEPSIGDGTYLLGVSEFAIPEVMTHKLARFEELARYDFDGFMLNLRSHVLINPKAEYGFNPEIREALLRMGAGDIWSNHFNREAWLMFRADAFDRFLSGCRKLTGGRPLYVSVTDWRQPKRPGRYYGTCDYLKTLKLPWHWDKWFATGSVDGVSMYGEFFPEEFSGKSANGHPVVICCFREMLFPPPGATLQGDLQRWGKDGRIDEIELYEAQAISKSKEAQGIIREFAKP